MKTRVERRQRDTVCVLGGTGFVGGHLVTRLADAGYDVKVITRNRQRHRELLVMPTVSVVEANVHDAAVLQRETAGCDALINLVGILNERGRDGSGFRHAHIELTRKAIAACHANGIARLLHMSALKADAVNGPSNYLRSKGEAEALVRDANGEGLATTIFQPSVIFGPDDSFVNRFAALLNLPFRVFPLPRPNARFAPVFVGDVAEAFVRALPDEKTAGRSYQLCGPRVYSLRELVGMIARIRGQSRLIVGLPDTLARMQARLMEFVPGKPFSTDNYRSLTTHSICDSNGLGALGITATSCEALLPRYLTHDTPQTRMSQYRKLARRSS